MDESETWDDLYPDYMDYPYLRSKLENSSMVEQVAVNHPVVGSSPASPAKKGKKKGASLWKK
jgi:hypothetical protein